MNLLPDIECWLLQQGHHAPFRATSISGGNICDSYRLDTGDGKRYFVKQKAAAPLSFFSAEAAGLRAIATTNTISTPKVFHFSSSFLLLEYLPVTSQHHNYWQTFAEQLASMHRITMPCFGFSMDNYCGSTAQPNPNSANGHDFFFFFFLLYQSQLAYGQGLLTAQDMIYVERLCYRLADLIPVQPACLVHGDLWSGNHHPGRQGRATLIDPACYWGWAETDIAMTKLFGGFPEIFYQHYHQHNPFQADWEERMDIYNLYHLLNHLNLFGHSYYAQVAIILKRYQ